MDTFITEHVDVLCARDLTNAQGDNVKLGTLSSTHRLDFTRAKHEIPRAEIDESEVKVSPSANIIVSANTVTISNKQNELIRLDAASLTSKGVAIVVANQESPCLHTRRRSVLAICAINVKSFLRADNHWNIQPVSLIYI